MRSKSSSFFWLTTMQLETLENIYNKNVQLSTFYLMLSCKVFFIPLSEIACSLFSDRNSIERVHSKVNAFCFAVRFYFGFGQNFLSPLPKYKRNSLESFWFSLFLLIQENSLNFNRLKMKFIVVLLACFAVTLAGNFFYVI